MCSLLILIRGAERAPGPPGVLTDHVRFAALCQRVNLREQVAPVQIGRGDQGAGGQPLAAGVVLAQKGNERLIPAAEQGVEIERLTECFRSGDGVHRPVPGADALAQVAAEDASAQLTAQGFGERFSFRLRAQAPRDVYPSGSVERLNGAGGDACAAVFARCGQRAAGLLGGLYVRVQQDGHVLTVACFADQAREHTEEET